MPRGIKRRAKARFTWTTEQRKQLITGFEFFGNGFGREIGHPTRPLDLTLARRAWEELGPELLDEFIQTTPFARPWAWWCFDAPEARGEAGEHEEGEDADAYIGSPAWWARNREGVNPAAFILLPSRGCESFRAYHTRLGLLTDAERELMYFPLSEEEDESIPLTITELRYVQFLSPQLGLFVGKFTTLGGDFNEFAAGRGDSQFLSHSFLSASVTALVNPYSTLGAGVIINPTKRIAITSSLYSAADSSTTTGFDTLGEGWVWSTSIRGQYLLGGLPGGMMVTAQYAFDNSFVDFRGQFVPPDDTVLPRTDDSWNVFWNGWQYLYVEAPTDALINVTDGRTDLQGVGLFARAAIADPDTNPVKLVISGGVAGKGIIPGRDHDTFGIGYSYSDIREAPFITNRVIETSSGRFEAYYALALTPGAELTIDAQWADSIVTGNDPAWLLGVRLRLSF